MRSLRRPCAAGLLWLVALAGCARRDGADDPLVFRGSHPSLLGRVSSDVRVNSWDHERGGELDLEWRLRLDVHPTFRAALPGMADGLWVAWWAERVFDPSGKPLAMSNLVGSTRLSATGLAIEGDQALVPSHALGHFYGTPIDAVERFPIPQRIGRRGLELSGSLTRALDESVPPGLYRLGFDLVLDGRGHGPLPYYAPLFSGRMPLLSYRRDLILPHFTGTVRSLEGYRSLPLVRVGEVATPRLPWVLFPDVHVDGHAGALAREDRGLYELSNRVRFPTAAMIEPGERLLEPTFPTIFPSASRLAHSAPREIPLHLDYDEGFARIVVTTPDGRAHDLGEARFAGRAAAGPRLELASTTGGGARPRFDFEQWGRHRITLAGEAVDVRGRVFAGGGHYEVYVARPLALSTPTSMGRSFSVGDAFPFQVQLTRAVAADLEIELRFLPRSDPARERRVVLRERSNRYGYFRLAGAPPRFVFDEPGEYVVRTRAIHEDVHGTWWMGEERSAGIVSDAKSRLLLHGFRDPGIHGYLRPDEPHLGMAARFRVAEEQPRMLTPLTIISHDVQLPHRSGDVLYEPVSYSGEGFVSANFSVEALDDSLRQDIVAAFPTSPLLSWLPGQPGTGEAPPALLRLDAYPRLTYPMGEGRGSDMLPLLSRGAGGLHPALFPELRTVEAYAYVNVARPGLSVLAMVTDSTTNESAWVVSPNAFGEQLEAGPNGALPGDVYRVSAGLVYRDLARDRVDYAPYAATIAIRPKGTNELRVSAPLAAPLTRVRGEDLWLGIDTDPPTVLEVGQSISLDASVFPAVPATVERSLRWPDGRIERAPGQADAQGHVAGPELRLDQPGVYEMTMLAHHEGRSGGLPGAPGGRFRHYVVPHEPAGLLRVERSSPADDDAAAPIELEVTLPATLTDATIAYSLFVPGALVDEGELTVIDGRARYRIRPRDIARQLPAFDVVDFGTGEPIQPDSLTLVLYAEGRGADGRRLHDAIRLIVRGGRLRGLAADDPSAAAEEAEPRYAERPQGS